MAVEKAFQVSCTCSPDCPHVSIAPFLGAMFPALGVLVITIAAARLRH